MQRVVGGEAAGGDTQLGPHPLGARHALADRVAAALLLAVPLPLHLGHPGPPRVAVGEGLGWMGVGG